MRHGSTFRGFVVGDADTPPASDVTPHGQAIAKAIRAVGTAALVAAATVAGGCASFLAGEIAITGKAAVDLMGKSSGVSGTGKAGVKIDGNMVALKGSTIDVNPGGVAAAAKADATVSEVPDSDPAGGSGGGAAGGQASAQAGGGGGGSSGGGSGPAGGGAGNASPGPAAAESAAAEPPEPVPALLSARWAQSKAPVGATVELAAMCLDLAGQAASFEIRPVDGGAAVATVSGTCGDAVASATWTTPKDTRIAQYTFTVTAGGQSAEGDVLTLVKPFAATLMLDEHGASTDNPYARSEA